MGNRIAEVTEEAETEPAPRMVDLSIVVVTWNSRRWIERCLASIDAACDGFAFEVVVFDNASQDGTADVVERIRDAAAFGTGGERPLRLVRSGSNAGFAAATNRAIALSSGRYIFLLNPDCELAPRSLVVLRAFLESHPQAAAAAPLLSDDDGDSQRVFQLRRLPTLGQLAAEVLLFDKLFPRNPVTRRYRYEDIDLDVPQRIEQPAAAALLLRRDVFDSIGPFDEQFAPAWFEDVDYCRRLAERGREIWVVPAARAKHFGGASLETMSFEEFTVIWYGNMWKYARKWLRPGRAESLRWMIVAGMLLRCASTAAGLRPKGVSRREAFRAYSSVLRSALSRWSAD